ncbi:MAG TPA: ECF-type sigma factor [Casimicrobiaceae bacterium]
MAQPLTRPDSTVPPRPGAAELFRSLYAELHRLAQSQLRKTPGAALSATTLLHEAYLDLHLRDPARFPDRARFMAYAARAMRGIVIDYARRQQAYKRGGEFHLTSLDTEAGDASDSAVADAGTLARIGDAVDALAQADPMLSEIVDLKFFGGLTLAEIAALRNVSARTIERDWLKARIFLRRILADDAP